MKGLEREQKGPELKFDASENAAKFSGTLGQVKRLLTDLLRIRHSGTSEEVINVIRNTAIAEGQCKLGPDEKIEIKGKRNSFVLLYMPDTDLESARKASIEHIKQVVHELSLSNAEKASNAGRSSESMGPPKKYAPHVRIDEKRAADFTINIKPGVADTPEVRKNILGIVAPVKREIRKKTEGF